MREPEEPRIPWVESLTEHGDERGTLVELTTAGGPDRRWCRAFTITVPGPTTRGGHGHRTCTQGLVAMNGHARVRSFDGLIERVYLLSRPSDVLVVPPLNWLDLEFEEASTLLVIADRLYEVEDYIYSREELTRIREQLQRSTPTTARL